MDEHRATEPTQNSRLRIAVLWRGDPNAPDLPAPHEARLRPVIDALHAVGFAAHGVIWFDEQASAIEAQLADCAGVLVWINPLASGRDRSIVDGVLRRVASAGVWVSTHPDVTALMGTKQVLFTTREVGWSSSTDLYDDLGDFEARFWSRLALGHTRVLKPLRGNDGQGVMKVAMSGRGIDIQHAGDDRIERVDRDELASRVREALSRVPLIDQAFNDNIAAGMVRCYLSQGHVIGFAEQQPRQVGVNAIGMKSAKTMHLCSAPDFADLRHAMETDWVPAMQKLLRLSTERLPVLWDADFFYRAPGEAKSRSRFVLCEINVSCVSPFPEAAPAAIASAVKRCLAS